MLLPALPMALLLLTLPLPALAATREDAALLLAFKATFSNGDEALSNWEGNDPCKGVKDETKFEESSWAGVVCKDNVVLSLSRSSRDKPLEGTLPASGWEFPATMTSLFLSEQSFSGGIPPGFKLAGKGLATIHMTDCNLEGQLPAEPFVGVDVKELHLLDNQFSGECPRWQRVQPAAARGTGRPASCPVASSADSSQLLLYAFCHLPGMDIGKGSPTALDSCNICHAEARARGMAGAHQYFCKLDACWSVDALCFV
jgi:hypothetical protein